MPLAGYRYHRLLHLLGDAYLQEGDVTTVGIRDVVVPFVVQPGLDGIAVVDVIRAFGLKPLLAEPYLLGLMRYS